MQPHRTLMPPISYPFSINYSNTLIFLGSCFSENIGRMCKYYGFRALVNPYHIIYNPSSLAKQVNYLLSDSSIDNSLFLQRNHTTYHYDFHSQIKAKDIPSYKELLKFKKESFFKNEINQPIVFLTLGTSWIYQLRDSKKIVANCHKQQNKMFEKRILSIDEVISNICHSIKIIQNQWSDVKIVLTVSPIRHLKDGFIENQRSKSRLIEAIHHICKDDFNIYYFPSYEIIMDDLRDYRYYGRDMVHPSDLAIDYIWDYFKNSFLDKKMQELTKRVYALYRRKNHKFLNQDPEQHKEFLQKTMLLEKELLQQNKEINLNFDN